MAKRPTRQEDAELVCRCLDDDPAAWQRLMDEYGPGIEATIVQSLGRANADKQTVDEIAANVKDALCDENFAALRNYGGRCSLSTYLSSLTRRQIARYWRERERRARQVFLSEIKLHERAAQGDETPMQLELLMRALTPRELEYFNTHLLRPPTEAEAQRFTAQSAQKIRERIRKKLGEIRRTA